MSPIVLTVVLASVFGNFDEGVPQFFRERIKDSMVAAAAHGYWCRDIGISLDNCKRTLRDALDKQDRNVK